ncbi:MAG: protein meaA [Actinomycetota bacterium]|nr:protein meaA [Actinomycetota bacterium]
MQSKDRPWIFRTYAGHTSAKSSNELYHTNLAKGQTGLSVAFDLPTQTGYDADHPMARGEVGRVGVPIGHLGDMRALFNGIPLAQMNTSMTINATAMWLLALYVVTAEEQGADIADIQGTTQNDILKEYLARGTYIFPPEPSMRLTTEMVVWTLRNTPRWNPINVCSYHLQEAGATPVQEVAFTLANAIAVLDATKATGQVSDDDLGRLVGRISFFCNAGIRVIEEICKMRAFTKLWDQITAERYGVKEEKYRRFRYGVQVNSLGLTAVQPENNVYRIILEMLGATASKDARARAVQLPAWNEALGLPRPWDQQWSLRAQQILALETDLLEYDDIFEGSKVVEAKTEELIAESQAELDSILEAGGSISCIDHMKEQLVAAHAKRQRAIESGEQQVIGVNSYTSTEVSPLVTTFDDQLGAFHTVADKTDELAIDAIESWRSKRDGKAAAQALDELRRAAKAPSTSSTEGTALMEASIAAARAGVTTGEWGDALRESFGEFRAPTGVSDRSAAVASSTAIEEARTKVADVAAALGVPRLRFLVAKPGLDGHSNAAEQVAVRGRDVGFEVIYQGIRLTPTQIARAAADEDVDAIGLSILSGAHNFLVADVLRRLLEEGVDPATVPVIVGGVIPSGDEKTLLDQGVARVFTPKDHDLTAAMVEIAELIRVRRSNGRA